MGFRLAILVLFFLAFGLILRGILRKRDPSGIRSGYLLLGHLFALFFGLLLSPALFSVIDVDTKRGLVPILEMSFGWVGFLFGFQFNITTLARIPGSHLRRAIAESLTAFAVVAVSSYFILRIYGGMLGIRPPDVLKNALAFGAVLSISSPTLIGIIQRRIRSRSPLTGLLTVTTSIDGLTGLVTLGVINIFWHPAGLALYLVLGLTLLLGLGQAFLIWLLLQSERKAIPTAILGIGVLTLGAGMSAYLGLAPVVPGALAGIVAANLAPGLRQRLARMLLTAESGLYLGLIVLAGVFLPTMGQYSAPAIMWVCFTALCLRFLGKMAGGALIYTGEQNRETRGRRWLFGCSLQSGGALLLAVALCYSQTMGGSEASIIVVTALATFIVGEILSVYSLPRLL